MKYILLKETDPVKGYTLGGKANNLFRLAAIGMNVPKFLVLPQEVLASLIPEEIRHAEYSNIIDFIANIAIPQTVIEDIVKEFPGTKFYAVRSSAPDEDGENYSFAGQFESYLFVTKDYMAEKIKCVWRSAFSKKWYTTAITITLLQNSGSR